MKKPYLIQRCTYQGFNIAETMDNKTITATYKPDYMGSSEFEYGALPNSLIRMGKMIAKYCITTLEIYGKEVHILCPKDAIIEYTSYLEVLAKEKYGNLKEVIHFADYFDEARLKEKADREKLYQKRLKNPNFKMDWEDTWWDIENDVIWSFNKDAINNWPAALENSLIKMNKKDEKEIWEPIARAMSKLLIGGVVNE